MCNGLASLEGGTPMDAPAADQLVREAAGVAHEALALTEGKLIAAAEVEDIANVEVSQTIVGLDSEAGNARSAIAIDIATGAVFELPPFSRSLASVRVFEKV